MQEEKSLVTKAIEAERRDNYTEAVELRTRIGDMVGAERNEKRLASIRQFGYVVPDFEQRYLAGRDYW